MGVGEKARKFCGVLMVKSRCICGELWSIEWPFLRSEDLPLFATLFCIMAGGGRGCPEFAPIARAVKVRGRGQGAEEVVHGTLEGSFSVRQTSLFVNIC